MSLKSLDNSLWGNSSEWNNMEDKKENEEEEEKSDCTPFQLLDHAIEDIGIGWVQKELLMVTSFGQFIDAAETAMLGVVLPFLETEFSATETDLALVGSLTAVGMMLGAPLFGRLSDLYGRKSMYQISLSLCIIFGFASSYMTDIVSFSVTRLFLGLGYGGNMVACTTLLIEYVPARSRGLYMSLSGLAFGFGAIFIVGLSWIAMPTIGWRWIMRIASFLGIPALIGLSFVPESLRFYIMKGDYERAAKGVETLAIRNASPIPVYFTEARLAKAANMLEERRLGLAQPIGSNQKTEDTEGPQYLDEVEETEGADDPLIPRPETPKPKTKSSSILCGLRKRKEKKKKAVVSMDLWKEMTTPYVLRNLIPLFFIWSLNAFSISIFFWVPLEIKKRYRNDPNVLYEIAFTLAVGGMFGSIVTIFLTLRYGRLGLLRASSLITGVSIILMGAIQSEVGLFVVAFIAQTVETILISTLYLYTPEVFPTGIRVTAFGVCAFGFRLAPTVAPFVIAALIDVSFELACIVMGGVLCIGFVLTWSLKVVTFNTDLVEEETNIFQSHTAPSPTPSTGSALARTGSELAMGHIE